MDTAVTAVIQAWLEDPAIAELDKQEIRDLLAADDEKELTDRFYRDLEFGTGAQGDMACHLMDPATWFLGLGDPNLMSWGYMIGAARTVVRTAAWQKDFLAKSPQERDAIVRNYRLAGEISGRPGLAVVKADGQCCA